MAIDAGFVENSDDALSGIRVVELGSGMAPAIVGMFLGDHGADVIKVEQPEGDWARSHAGFAVWNRNKRGAVVDLESADDLAWLATNVGRADVLILGTNELEDFGPAVAEAARGNARLVIVRLPAYLDGSTPWVGTPESNGLLSAMGSQASRQSSYDGGPVESVSPYVLHGQGLLAATAATAALLERIDSGLGQTVTVTGMQALVQFHVLALTTLADAPDPVTSIGPTGKHHTYRHFEAKGGRWIAAGGLGGKFETRLLQELGLQEILDHPDVNGITANLLAPERAWARQQIEETFAERTVEELIELMQGIGIPCGEVADRDSWLDNEQIKAIGMRAEVVDDAGNTIVMPGVPFVLTKTPGSVRTAAPRLTQGELPEPWADRDIAAPTGQPRLTPGPLHGYTVLNTGTFVATPYAGFLLAELGANVIKVEPLTGDPFRTSAYACNRGMRSIAIDLASDAGRDTFHRLTAVSNVVIDGMRPGVMKKLGIDYDTLAAINPGIVALSLSAYGEGGPDSMLPGVDMVIQAQSGMMSSQGGDSAPVANTVAVNDVITAAMTALAVTIALYSQRVTGEGQRIWNSLIGTSAFLQDNELVRYDGRPEPARGGRDFLGAHPLQYYYQVANGWVYVDADPALDQTLEGLAPELERAGLLAQGEGDLAERLSAALLELSRDAAVQALSDIGVRAAASRTVPEVVHDGEFIDHEVFHIRMEDETGVPFIQTGRHAGFTRNQRSGPLLPPGIGQHTRPVLSAAGFSADEIDALINDGHVRVGGEMLHRLAVAYR